MNSEKLKRANELYEAIKKGREEIAKWEWADAFDASNLIKLYNSKGTGREHIHPEFIPFDIVKTLTLDRLRKELSELENEFVSI